MVTRMTLKPGTIGSKVQDTYHCACLSRMWSAVNLWLYDTIAERYVDTMGFLLFCVVYHQSNNCRDDTMGFFWIHVHTQDNNLVGRIYNEPRFYCCLLVQPFKLRSETNQYHPVYEQTVQTSFSELTLCEWAVRWHTSKFLCMYETNWRTVWTKTYLNVL